MAETEDAVSAEAIWACYSHADEDTWVVECPSQNALAVGDNREDAERLMTEAATDSGAWGVAMVSGPPPDAVDATADDADRFTAKNRWHAAWIMFRESLKHPNTAKVIEVRSGVTADV